MAVVRLTAESQSASQDPNRGSHPKFEATCIWCNVTVAQFCTVTYSHWQIEERTAHTCELDVYHDAQSSVCFLYTGALRLKLHCRLTLKGLCDSQACVVFNVDGQ